MDCDDFEKTLKVIVVGNGNVGKTSMTTRYAKGKYTGNYKKTIGVDFMEKSVELRDLGETVNLMIWDTAGQEEFDTLTSRYYKGAGAVIYVFSTVDRDSFDDLPKWKRKVEKECGRICHVLVQNKIDLVEDAAMSRAEVEDMADYMNICLFRSCVQDNINVKEVFEHLCRQFLKYGGSGGSDDTLSAVADITSLSELASRSGERSGSGHYHATNGKGSAHSERRGKREVSDISDTGSEHSEQPQQRTPGARGPSEKPFPPSVPASIAKDRANGTRYDDGDGSERGSDDEDASGTQRGSRDRRQGPRRHKDTERDYDNDSGDDEDTSRRRHRPESRDNDSSQDKRSASRRSDRSNAQGATEDATGLSSSSSTSKTKASADAREDSRRSAKQNESDRHAQDQRTRSSGNESDRDGATNAPNGASTHGHEAPDAMRNSSNGMDRDDASESTTAPSATKLQPSKRRTNGKKRQPVPECVLS